MKLPTLWIASAFAVGIGVSSRWSAPPKIWFLAAGAAILLAGILLRRQLLAAAWVMALVSWTVLGGLAFGVERSAVPPNHVTHLISPAGGALIDISEPLRWRGRLREDTMTLPWGHRYEIELEEVEAGGSAHRGAGRSAR
jgi:peptidoglycan/LPS O-acetylase OafA/YrhL